MSFSLTIPAPSPSDTVTFYWELPASELAGLRSDNAILEDEGYLAHDLNWGRQLMDLQISYVPVPDVDPSWAEPQLVERFSDAISAILHVAGKAGFDIEEVCAAALSTRRGVENASASAAAHRQGFNAEARQTSG